MDTAPRLAMIERGDKEDPAMLGTLEILRRKGEESVLFDVGLRTVNGSWLDIGFLTDHMPLRGHLYTLNLSSKKIVDYAKREQEKQPLLLPCALSYKKDFRTVFRNRRSNSKEGEQSLKGIL